MDLCVDEKKNLNKTIYFLANLHVIRIINWSAVTETAHIHGTSTVHDCKYVFASTIEQL